MIIKRFDDNHGICIHLLKSLINFYSLGYKNYLNSEMVLFFSKNYYFRFFFEWFFSLRELFRLDFSLNSIRLSLLGIRFGINFEKAESVRKLVIPFLIFTHIGVRLLIKYCRTF